MSCNFPIRKFNPPAPCGRCLGCRIDRSKQWQIRLTHELSLWQSAMFVTFTYTDKNCPPTLIKKHFQLMMKRFRKKIFPLRVSYYIVGEYGDTFGRPHGHAIIFGFDFREHEKLLKNGHLRPDTQFKNIWPFGLIHVGDVNKQSIGYCAKYVQKKLMGEENKAFYEAAGLEPEFSLVSKKPAIGFRYYKSLKSRGGVKHDLKFYFNGQKVHWPKYYKRKLAETAVKQPTMASGITRSTYQKQKAEWLVSKATRLDWKHKRNISIALAQDAVRNAIADGAMANNVSHANQQINVGKARELFLETKLKMKGA